MPEDLCYEPHPDQPEVTCDKPTPCIGYHANGAANLVWGYTPLPPKRTKAGKAQGIVDRAKPSDKTGPPDGHRDGETYVAPFDYDRLNNQAKRVYDCISNGSWWTLADIAAKTHDPEASISARLRDLRKPRFGALDIEHRRVHQGKGEWEYRLVGDE